MRPSTHVSPTLQRENRINFRTANLLVISKGNGNRLIKVWDGMPDRLDIRAVGYSIRQEILRPPR